MMSNKLKLSYRFVSTCDIHQAAAILEVCIHMWYPPGCEGAASAELELRLSCPHSDWLRNNICLLSEGAESAELELRLSCSHSDWLRNNICLLSEDAASAELELRI